ncbi:MAG TPA: c-type cytochrome [Vitreimonas sp.]|uniref:c-type cytochrome n=1 Tax=Vitreimonas sp. TaxID=3069702 RepID=UPI002D34A65C|nr:c-type cytochrome [Vitreimonas sp.]HYD88705.1 c-type cytochrome [Vitreimonas sp.]
MRKLGLAAAALALLGACAQPTAAPTREALVERGDYLVNNVVLCGDCHTPMGPNGPDHTRHLQGAPNLTTVSIPIPWGEVAPPIAGLPANYTEEQFIAFLQTGVRPDGSHPRPPMPPYRLNEDDARAVAAYIATVPRAEENAQQN